MNDELRSIARAWFTLVLCLVALVGANASDFIPLGDLPGGAFSSQAFGISADGSTVVGVGTIQDGLINYPRAFRWTAETGMMALGVLPDDTDSFAFATSADGSTVVGISASELFVDSFQWTVGQGMVRLDSEISTSFPQTFDLSDDGSTAVGMLSTLFGNVAMHWNAGRMPNSMTLGEDDVAQFANGISGDGTTVVGAGVADSNVQHP